MQTNQKTATTCVDTAIAKSVPQSALQLISALEAAGFEAWIVGGAVRDAVMGHTCHDIDIATRACWQETSQVAQSIGFDIHETGVKHGTVTAVAPDPARNAYEVTTYRTDGSYSDGRHPDEVRFVRTIDEDLARRDFTMNAMAWHPTRGLHDPYNGASDIANATIRVVGDARKRFGEDALRILRAARFASQLGFEIEPATFQAMHEQKHMLAKVSHERISAEIDRLLLGKNVASVLVDCADILSFVLPELVAMNGCEQHTKYHIYDVLGHTAVAVGATKPTLMVRWAALCHDMGKPAAAFFDEDGVEHFYGHAKISCVIARPLLQRMCKSDKFTNDVLTLIKYHDDVIEPTEKSVKRALKRLDGRTDLFDALCDLKQADASAQAPMCADRINLAHELLTIKNKIVEGDGIFSLKNLAINGHDVIDAGIAAGPAVGIALNHALDAVIDGITENNRQSLLKFIQSLPLEFHN